MPHFGIFKSVQVGKSSFCLRRHFYRFSKRYSSAEARTKSLRKKWQSVIGIEVHAQISSSSKLFSAAGVDYSSMTNDNVSLFDAALPGTLPVLNKRCVEAAILTSLALKAELNKVSLFDRKHYFYADLPAGYQITQQRKPIAKNGHIDFVVFNPAISRTPYPYSVSITQIQMEQDSGKSLHDDQLNRSLIDLNRAGIGLVEIVFAPDLRNGEEAAALIKELILILRAHDVCSCRMEEGALRVDANISVNKPGEPFGTRSEVKNINSVRGVCNAIEYEIDRQISLIENGGTVINETRSYDSVTKTTVSMRDKEVLQDYRYMPEPNLPPLRLYDSVSENFDLGYTDICPIRGQMRRLPNDIRIGLVEKFELTLEQAAIIVNIGIDDMFLEILETTSRSPKIVVKILLQHFLAEINDRDLSIENCGIKASNIGEITDAVQAENITMNIAKEIMKMMFDGDKRSPRTIIDEDNFRQIKDISKLTTLCDEIIKDNPSLVDKYKAGKTKLINVLVAEAKNRTNGRANLKIVSEILVNQMKTT